jgi:hypothetical protein
MNDIADHSEIANVKTFFGSMTKRRTLAFKAATIEI